MTKWHIGYFKDDESKELTIFEEDDRKTFGDGSDNKYCYGCMASDEDYTSDEVVMVLDITDFVRVAFLEAKEAIKRKEENEIKSNTHTNINPSIGIATDCKKV